MKAKFLAFGDDRVTRIVAALSSCNVMRFFGEQVDHLPLAFISPLHADDGNTFFHPIHLFMGSMIAQLSISLELNFLTRQDPPYFLNF